MNYLVFIGNKFESNTSGVEKYLPEYLSKYGKVICFEYPHFSSLFSFTRYKYPKTNSLHIHKSFGLLPLGRIFPFINKINHLVNYYYIRLFLNNFFTNKPITIITFTPEYEYLAKIIPKTKKIIYFVSDDYKTLPQWKGCWESKQFDELEKTLLSKSDIIIVVSNTLNLKYKKNNKNIKIWQTPANTKLFTKNLFNVSPHDIVNISHPIAGFMGSLTDWKVNITNLIKLIKMNPDISFVFIGTINIGYKYQNILSTFSNYHYLGWKEYSQLPQYTSQFDICLVPYKTNSYGQSAYPVKIMEYLALGKPVVSTALPSIKYLADEKIIYWSKNYDEFQNNLLSSIKEKAGKKIRNHRIQEALKNDWEVRIKEFIKIIHE